ncbi:MAG: protoporphyrinogen oxidase [Acidobacteria bacterium]|nr:protoporphyrinogen oxidase [Acidobacteriota bacterium]
MIHVDAAVVGGGIAGLAAAYELSTRGVPFVVLERGGRAGGVILSEQIDGYTIDGGPDALLIQKPDGIRLCEEIGLGERLVPTKLPRFAYIQRGGRLHPLPTGSVMGFPTRIAPFLGSGLFSWRGKLRMGAELFVPARHDEGDESIGSFITRRFGVEATRYLAEPLLAGIHAGDVDRLSMAALFPRFLQDERKHGSLLRAFRSRSRTPASSEGAFKSLPDGLTEMVTALVAALPAGTVRLNAPVTRIGGAGPFQLDVAGGDSVLARSVILATPAFATAALFHERDAAIARTCREIPYASAATVALAFRREDVRHPLNGTGFVVPRAEASGILAGSWLSSKWPHRAPENRVLLRAFVGGARDPQALDRSDAELISLSLGAMRTLLGIRGEPLLTRVYRWERANAQHEVGHLARVAAIDAALARHPGLFLTGSGFRGTGIPDCVADGRAIAAQVTKWLATLTSVKVGPRRQ